MNRRTGLAPLLGLLFLAGLSGALAAPAFGQESQPPAEDTATPEETDQQEAESSPTMTEEIVVTARKREENVQEVPVAVTVVRGEALEETAAQDISELQAQVPNLSIYQGRNQSTTLTAFMRGIGQADPLWGVDPGVGLYLDDVYMARPQGALLDVFDVQRIEVLRGPQGTLYGKNTIGGAIKYVSRELTDQKAGLISFTPGDYGNQDIRASVSGALVPGKLRGKLAIASLQHDGYGTNHFTGNDVSDKDTLALRAALDWLPREGVKVQFAYDKTKDDANPKGHSLLEPNPLCPAFLGRTCPVLPDTFDNNAGLAPLNSTDAQGGSLVIGWDLSSAWRIKSITAFRESDSENNIDFDTTPARITDVIATYYDEQFTQEFQFLYDGGGKFTGVFGAYYFDGEAGGLVKNIFLNRIFGTTEGKTLTDSLALFGEGSYDLSDRLTLNLGLRATQEDKNGIALNRGFTNDTFTVPNAVTANYDKTASFDSIAPKLGLDYRFTEDVMGYVSLSRGFKSGGFNVRANTIAAPGSDLPFDDEILDVVEVGVKSVLNDRKLVLNAAAFYGDYKDVQVSTFTTVNGAFFGQFLNAGNATMKGVEVEFDASSVGFSWLSISGQASYLGVDPDPLDNNRDGFVDTQVITNAPKLTGAIRATGRGVVAKGVLVGSVGYAHRDDSTLTNEGGQYPGRPGTPLLPITQKAYGLVDGYLSWLAPNGKWRVAVNGKNLANKEYLTNGYNIPSLSILQGAQGNPRMITGTIEFKF